MRATEEELPSTIVLQDQELEAQRDDASASLAKLRWQWTLDESNPKRVSIRSYAEQVGRAEKTIRSMAKA